MIITAGHLTSLYEVLDSLLLLRIVIFLKLFVHPLQSIRLPSTITHSIQEKHRMFQFFL